MNTADIDRFICGALRGDVLTSLGAFDEQFGQGLIERAQYHGVTALLNECVAQNHALPSAIKDSLRQKAVIQALRELEHRRVITDALHALAGKGITPLLFKGTALAYSHYHNPICRTRGDSDLIVQSSDAVRTDETLQSLGFVPTPSIDGDLIIGQRNYDLTLTTGRRYSIDLHWRISNAPLLSELFSYSELNSAAIPLPSLCIEALGVGSEHAMLLACLHRLVHKVFPYYVGGVFSYGGNRLIWLYDIHLLAKSLNEERWQTVFRLAAKKGLCSVTLDGIESANEHFGTPYPPEARKVLLKEGEKIATYLDSGAIRRLWIDLNAIRGMAAKLQFIGEMLLPSAAYMQSKYDYANSASLPWLYVQRAVSGFLKSLSNDKRCR